MKKQIALICSISIISFFTYAQSLDLKWSKTMMYDNKLDGFFNEFIDANSKYVYAKYNNLAIKPKKANRKIKFIAYDKNTMEKVAEARVKGYGDGKTEQQKFDGLNYYKTLVFENVIYSFWIREEKQKEELFVETYDAGLKLIAPLKKIYEISSNTSKRSKYGRSILVLSNKKFGEKVVIGGELPAEKEQNVKFEYKLLNSDLTFANANQVELPIKLLGKNYGLTSNYTFGDDGNLYISSFVSMSKEERKLAKKGESMSYSIFSAIDIANGKLVPFTFKFDNKNIFNLGYTVTKSGVKVYGFFCDLNKDPQGNDMHGIFYSILDSKQMTMTATNFTYFDKATLDKLFAKDKEDQKTGKKKTRNQQAKVSDDESLDGRFEIENVQTDGDDIILFTSKMTNWSTTTCDSKGNCTTRYYCTKDNITTFKVNKNGDLVWASNLDREMTYSGWNIYDVRVMKQNNNFYAVYGSRFGLDADVKNRKSKKSKSDLRDRVEYAVFNNNDGSYKKEEIIINADKTPKKERKAVNPLNITVINDVFYVNSQRVRLKPGLTTLYCLASLPCPLFLVALSADGNVRKGTGNLGVIKPIK
jgi:hypothetical protein